ncbi:MAG: hypothetical protein AAB570_02835 [Patescibacteria group bacterium]
MNELSIVIPCLSSLRELPDFFQHLSGELMKNSTDVDVIVVTQEHAQEATKIAAHVKERYPWLQCSVLQSTGGPKSYGALARFGTAYSSSRYVALVSPYNEDDLSILGTMLSRARGGAQLVQATRYADTDAASGMPWKYRLYQRLYRFLVRLCVGADVTDSTYAYKLFDRTFVLALGLTHNGYSVCPEITLKSLLAGAHVAYVPTTFRVSDLNQDFHLLKEGVGYLRVLWRAVAHRMGVQWF